MPARKKTHAALVGQTMAACGQKHAVGQTEKVFAATPPKDRCGKCDGLMGSPGVEVKAIGTVRTVTVPFVITDEDRRLADQAKDSPVIGILAPHYLLRSLADAAFPGFADGWRIGTPEPGHPLDRARFGKLDEFDLVMRDHWDPLMGSSDTNPTPCYRVTEKGRALVRLFFGYLGVTGRLDTAEDLAEAATALAKRLNKAPSCRHQLDGQACTRNMRDAGIAFPKMKPQDMCDACAAMWHVSMAEIALRRRASEDREDVAKAESAVGVEESRPSVTA